MYPPSSHLGGHVCLCNCISRTSFFPALLTISVVTRRGVGMDVCYFDRFSNSWCKHFEQDAMNISLEHFKEQHTGIWCLLVNW